MEKPLDMYEGEEAYQRFEAFVKEVVLKPLPSKAPKPQHQEPQQSSAK